MTNPQPLARWRLLFADINPRRLVVQIVAPVVAIVALFAFWQVYATYGEINSLLLPTPVQVARVTLSDWRSIAPALLATLTETAIGFSFALVFGLICAALLDLSSLLRQALYPLLVASQSVPIIALAPILWLLFGPDLTSKVIVIVLVCFFPITVAGLDGLRATDPELIRLYRGFGASAWQIFRAVRLPNALPSLFSGVRIAISYSVIGAIFSEYIGSNQGLGIYIRKEQAAFRLDLVIGAIVLTALASIALFLSISLIERLAIPWFYAERRRLGNDPRRS